VEVERPEETNVEGAPEVERRESAPREEKRRWWLVLSTQEDDERRGNEGSWGSSRWEEELAAGVVKRWGEGLIRVLEL
jgi:hypothetical protein